MKKPDKKKEPYTYDKWKRLGLLRATDTERVLMLNLHRTLGSMDWLLGKQEPTWDTKDMREFVREVASEIDKENSK
jgi:hypothetical protein